MPEPETPVAASPAENPPQGLEADPAPQAPPASQPDTPAAPPASEAPPEGGTESATEPPPEQPWKALDSREDLLAHEIVTEHVAEREQAAAKQARSDVQARVQGFVQKRELHMQGIEAGVGDLVKELKRLQRDKQTDPQAMSDLLDEHGETLNGVAGIQRQAGVWEGVSGAVTMIADASGNADLKAEFQPRAVAMGNGMPDESFWKEFAEALGATHAKTLLERETPKIEKRTEERIGLEARQNKRAGEPSATAVAGTGAGDSKPTLADVKKMTAEQIAKIPVEEMKAIMASG